MTLEKVEIKISGMSCAHCSSRVENALKNLEGVEKANVDLKDGKATVEFDPEKLKLSELEHAIEKAGYSVVN